MSLNINQARQSGFTIVELLIVVVVIAILAAITIVSYNGITQQANTAAAQANASNIIKKAEAFGADAGNTGYPEAFADLTGASTSEAYYLSASGFTLIDEAIDADTPASKTPGTISFQVCGHDGDGTAPASIAAMTVVTGNIVTFWNFTSNTTATMTAGNTTTGGTPNIACFYAAT